MKMKYLKTFENFGGTDMGRFSDVDSDEQEWLDKVNPSTDGLEDENDEFGNEQEGDERDEHFEEEEREEEEDFEEEEPVRRKVWGDEIVEKKKMNAGFKAYLDKKKGKAKKDDKKADTKEDKKDDKKAEKKEPKKGLTAGQKKLPEAMQKAILKKQK